jgi:hypothetical protein
MEKEANYTKAEKIWMATMGIVIVVITIVLVSLISGFINLIH